MWEVNRACTRSIGHVEVNRACRRSIGHAGGQQGMCKANLACGGQ